MKVCNDLQSIKISEIQGNRLRGKPKCPYCSKPLIFIYHDAKEGHVSQKCQNCKKISWLDLKSMQAYRIEKDEDHP